MSLTTVLVKNNLWFDYPDTDFQEEEQDEGKVNTTDTCIMPAHFHPSAASPPLKMLSSYLVNRLNKSKLQQQSKCVWKKKKDKTRFSTAANMFSPVKRKNMRTMIMVYPK